MTAIIHFLVISRSVLLRRRHVSDKCCREYQTKYFVFNNFVFINRAVYEVMWKNTVELDRPPITVRCVRIACWIPNATSTHSEYVILFFRCNSGCKNALKCYVIRKLPVL